MSSHKDMPDEFYQYVHQVLKTWYTPSSEEVLGSLLLAQSVHQRPDQVAPASVSKAVVQTELARLEQTNPAAYDLIRRRFIQQHTAQEIAYDLDVSVDVIYQRQRRALMQLAQRLWQEEMALRETRARRIEARLDAPSYTRLFGVREKIDRIRRELETPSEPWFLAFEGIGGVGKTALADALVRELAYNPHFHDIAWISARRRLFRLTGGSTVLEDVVNLTSAEFIDRLVEQLGLNDLKRRADREKFLGVKAHLSSAPCLIVVDNLETVRDYEALIPQLRQLADPSKFIITTRYSLRGESGVYIVPLQGLSPEQTVEFIRYEAELQGLSDLVTASDADLLAVYEVTGGNPLATKLVIGQVHTFSLSTILKRLEGCQGGLMEDMLDFIFADAWETLDAKSRWVLQVMLVTADAGGRLEQIISASNLDMTEVMTCMRALVRRSLVSVSGDLHERRYKLHPLTQSFVAQHVEEAFPFGNDHPG